VSRRSRFTKSERMAAVHRAVSGEGYYQVAKDLDIGLTTLYRWATEDPVAEEEGDSRTRLVRACQELLRQTTLADLTLNDVAIHANLAPRTAYNHFPNKVELFIEALNTAGHALSLEMTRRASHVGDITDPARAVRDLLRAGYDASQVVPESRLLFVAPPEDPKARRAVERWHLGLEDVLTQMLSRPEAQRRLRDGHSPASAARVVVATARSLTAAALDETESEPLRRALSRIPGLVLRRR
jgi:AcrR family transcriptional regulator